MRAREIGQASHAFLYPLSLLYGLGVRARLVSYRLGLLRSRSLPVKVVSVGNLTVGGTGKTPVTIFLAEFFKKDGKRVAILSRGYKGGARGPSVVSDGFDILMGPREAGDEPYLMASRLPGVPVVVCPDRVRGGEFIMERFSPNVLLLDDAFQHLRLERDINIVLLDSREGFGNGYMLPRGTLREPVSALKRADFAMIKGGAPVGRTWETLHEYSIPYIPFAYRAERLYNIASGEELPLASLLGQKVLAVSGIARPESFKESLACLGAQVAESMDFPDHHSYTEADARGMEQRRAEMIVTTEKDAVKLKGLVKTLPVFALKVEVDIDQGLLNSSVAPILRGVF